LTTEPFTRRDMFRNVGAGAILSGAGAPLGLAGAQTTPPPAAQRTLNVVELGADPSGQRDASAVFQRAIDSLAPTGGILYIPAGQYRIEHTLVWQNRENRRAPGILFQGDGQHTTVLNSLIGSGPLLRVRGVRTTAPVDTSYFWGGGIRDLSIRGNDGPEGQHGLEVLGWYYGEIQNCHFVALGGDGIRAVTDPSVDPNPDFTSSTLFLRGVWFERLGGWGFIDRSAEQGAPGWSWDRVVFIMCRKGGAHVRSGGHSFTGCSFASCGWQREGGTPERTAYGLYFDGGATACSQHVVQSCEFDNNLTAHIGARFLACSCFFANRFIFNDRFGAGHPCPRTGIQIGIGDVHAGVFAVLFRQNFFRVDIAGEIVGFDFINSANVRDITIGGSFFTAPTGARVTRYKGHDPAGRGSAYGYVIHDVAI